MCVCMLADCSSQCCTEGRVNKAKRAHFFSCTNIGEATMDLWLDVGDTYVHMYMRMCMKICIHVHTRTVSKKSKLNNWQMPMPIIQTYIPTYLGM